MGGITPEMLASMFPQGMQGQQPQQMSQQGQFNPADVQAQLSGGPAPPFSFAPGQGGVGSQILNALAQAGKAATYVAESPQEREAEQNRAQKLWETKQKMGLAAQEFGQKEKDRAQQAATQREQFSQMEKDRAAQRDIAQQGRDVENRKTDETIRHNQAIEAMKDDPADKKIDAYVDEKNVQHVIMQRKDNTTYELTYGKVRQPPSGDGKPVPLIDPATRRLGSYKSGQTVPEGAMTPSQFGTQPERVTKALKPYQDTLDMIEESRDYAKTPSATNDYGLLMNFIGVTKPESLAKLRLNQNEVNLAKKTRGFMGDVQALGQKLDSGQMLTPDQRKAMIDTMEVMGKAAQRNMQRVQSTPGMAPQGGAQNQGQEIHYKIVNGQLIKQ